LPNPIAKNSSGTPSRRLRLSQVGQVPHIFCATANFTEVILAETEQGRGILGVIDGFSPKGIEGEAEIKWRKDFLRKIGYKL
jgi:adenosine/AMP kinase